MVLFLYSDKNYERLAISCLKSLESKITDDIKIVYYTIGFSSDFDLKNLEKIEIVEDKLSYPSFPFYKAELALLTMELYPEEKHFIYSDVDILYSRRFNFGKFEHSYPYPLACFGPHEYPFLWELAGEGKERVIFNEIKLMEYFNVPERSMRYVLSWFFSFNQDCKDFFEEWQSMCRNRYLMSKRKDYFPFSDETPFNICLWKRNITKNYGYISTNTNLLSIIRQVEESDEITEMFSDRTDTSGIHCEYINDSSHIVFYHGSTAEEDVKKNLDYLIGNNHEK